MCCSRRCWIQNDVCGLPFRVSPKTHRKQSAPVASRWQPNFCRFFVHSLLSLLLFVKLFQFLAEWKVKPDFPNAFCQQTMKSVEHYANLLRSLVKSVYSHRAQSPFFSLIFRSASPNDMMPKRDENSTSVICNFANENADFHFTHTFTHTLFDRRVSTRCLCARVSVRSRAFSWIELKQLLTQKWKDREIFACFFVACVNCHANKTCALTLISFKTMTDYETIRFARTDAVKSTGIVFVLVSLST